MCPYTFTVAWSPVAPCRVHTGAPLYTRTLTHSLECTHTLTHSGTWPNNTVTDTHTLMLTHSFSHSVTNPESGSIRTSPILLPMPVTARGLVGSLPNTHTPPDSFGRGVCVWQLPFDPRVKDCRSFSLMVTGGMRLCIYTHIRVCAVRVCVCVCVWAFVVVGGGRWIGVFVVVGGGGVDCCVVTVTLGSSVIVSQASARKHSFVAAVVVGAAAETVLASIGVVCCDDSSCYGGNVSRSSSYTRFGGTLAVCRGTEKFFLTAWSKVEQLLAAVAASIRTGFSQSNNGRIP